MNISNSFFPLKFLDMLQTTNFDIEKIQKTLVLHQKALRYISHKKCKSG